MINFFRKTRHSLLNQGKTAKYLKYAIGEILLVVIGILIALQINNWNESKKSRAYELKMLSEIRKSILTDNRYLEVIVESRIKKNEINTQQLIRLIHQNDIESEAFNQLVKRPDLGFIFQYSSGAYQALKASGVDKISNDSLRNDLINFYDFMAPRTEKLINIFGNPQTLKQQKDLKWEVFEFGIVKTESGEDYSYDIVPKVYKHESYTEQQFLRYISTNYNKAFNSRVRIERYIEISKDVLEKLDKELAE